MTPKDPYGSGFMAKAESISELVLACRIDVQNLEQTVQRLNHFHQRPACRREHLGAVHRPDLSGPGSTIGPAMVFAMIAGQDAGEQGRHHESVGSFSTLNSHQRMSGCHVIATAVGSNTRKALRLQFAQVESLDPSQADPNGVHHLSRPMQWK